MSTWSRMAGVTVLCTVASALQAAPVRIEALITPKAESRLEFADGTKHYVLATQREGKASGTGPLAGASMLEWGLHDVLPGTGATGNGYLVFSASDGDLVYLKYQFRAVPVPGAEGKPRNLINGLWEVVGGTGKFKALRGSGVVRINAPSDKERLWVLEGDLVDAAEK